MSSVVHVDNVGKKFCRSLKRSMVYAAQDVAYDLVGMKSRAGILRNEEFWALNDVSFELQEGESLGLLGTNGAGKSTLLKMLNGIIRPDRGRIQMHGRIGALIEVGAGFHPMLTGRENIYVNGAILGMTKRELDRKIDSIVEFSGLAGYILDAPVKSYSSGMYVRLGFSVAIHCEPDILLVDEVLAVGDSGFRVRCSEWIANFLRRRGTLILVSHYLPSIRECCNKVMILKNGACQYLGETMPGLQMYQEAIAQTPTVAPVAGTPIVTSSPLQIARIRLSGTGESQPILEFDFDEPFQMTVEVEAQQPMEGIHLHLVFSNQEVGAVCGWTSRTLQPEGLNLPKGRSELQIDLGNQAMVPGNYSVIAYLSDRQHIADYHELMGPPFSVRPHSVVDSRFGSLMLKGNLHVQ